MTGFELLPVELTPRVERTLRRAAELSLDLGHSYLGTEHLLLALLDDPHGIAGQVLNDERGAWIREALRAIIANPGYSEPSNRRVLRVEGPRRD